MNTGTRSPNIVAALLLCVAVLFFPVSYSLASTGDHLGTGPDRDRG